jgi:hypothetical protein
MHAVTEIPPPSSIKSVSLAELPYQTPLQPPLFARVLGVVRLGLMICGALSLSAAGGVALVYLGGGPDEALLVSEEAAPLVVAAAPASEQSDSVEPIEDEPVRDEAARDEPIRIVEIPPPPDLDDSLPDLAADVQLQSELLMESEPLIVARLPRARPDEPIITGSIGRGDSYAPAPAYDPCEILQRLGAPFPVRCFQDSRGAPPPYPTYQPDYRPPHPYTPPW